MYPWRTIMTDQMNGMIILNAIPDAGVEQKVGEFLSGHAKNIPLDVLIKTQWIDLSFDNSRQNHMMLGADGFWILIGCPGKGHKVFPQITQRHNFIHQTVFCTEQGP